MYYINIFFIFSICGFLIENIWNYFFEDETGSGILIGPWTPIYGFSSIIIIIIFNLIYKYIHLPGFIICYLFALIMMIILTIIEYLGGIFIEHYFHKTFWDYSKFTFSYGKYICLEMSLIWAFSSVILAYVIEPLIHQYINNIPTYITIFYLILFIIDNIVTYLNKKVHK